MDYKYSSNIEWTNGVKEDHKVELNLDLVLDKILPSKNLALRLHAQSDQLRREITALVLAEILPKIIKGTGLEYDTPGHLHVSTHIDTHSEAKVGIPTLPSTMLMVRNTSRLVMDMHTNRPVNAIQALYGNRSGVAGAIANEVMKFLRRAVLDIHDKEYETNASATGNELKRLDHKVKRSSADNN